jgi:hypothetical protein
VSGCGCHSGEDCGCQDSPLLHGWTLGAITPDDATNQVFPSSKIATAAGHNQSIWNVIRSSASAGQMVDQNGAAAYIPGTAECAATGVSSTLKLASTASGMALTGLNIANAAGVVAAPFTLGVSIAIDSIIGIFGVIFGHHAAAVKKEQSVLCAAVPAANNYLQIIDQAVQSGNATPQDGIHALDSLLSDFESQVASIRHGSDPTSSGECNAACVMQSELHAIVLLKQSEYQDLIMTSPALPAGGAAAQTVTPVRPNTTAPAGTSVPASSYASFYSASTPALATAAPGATGDWLPVAALFVAGFLLLRGV